MRDKFRANFKIALPAAVVTLAVILVQSMSAGVEQITIPEYNLLLLIPYVLVLAGGIAGLNVFVVLVGILAGIAIVLPTGTVDFMSLLGSMGGGASGMFETIMVTVLVSAMCALIREFGGFEALLVFIRRVFRGRVGGRLGVGLLVGTMDIATANNTVAIVMAGPIAREISEEYHITPRSPPPCWIPSPACSRASSPTARRCWWPSPPREEPCPLSRSCPACITPTSWPWPAWSISWWARGKNVRNPAASRLRVSP
jgi:Na+/H+ antiporter NhaC